jgi:hypothetical protein
MTRPTPEQIQQVRKYDCFLSGHNFSIEYSRPDGRVRVVQAQCNRCHRSFNLVPTDGRPVHPEDDDA